jgi:hypothetical protein
VIFWLPNLSAMRVAPGVWNYSIFIPRTSQ